MAPWIFWLAAFSILLILIGIVSAMDVLFKRTARLGAALLLLYDLLAPLIHFPTALIISQLQGGTKMPITGILAGSSGTFGESPIPAGSAFPAGTTFAWTSSDAAVALTPSADTTSVVAAVPATDTAASFDLTCTSSFTVPGAAAPLAATVTVPITQPLPPTPTGIQIDQTA